MSELKLSDQFRLHFQQLISACDNSPKKLVVFCLERPQFTALAWDVHRVAGMIDRESADRKIHPQISAEFIRDWKDFQNKWRKEVDYVVQASLFANMGTEWGASPTFEESSARGKKFNEREVVDAEVEESFAPHTHDGGKAVASFMELASDRAMDRRANDFEPQYIANTYLIGVEALEYFQKVIGIDIQNAFFRWNNLPATFVPSHVSNRHGLTSKEGLFALHAQAVRAFVAGAPVAAIAMCRSLLELILKDHYLRGEVHKDDKLFDFIEIAASKYHFLNAAKMHDLRKGANNILHGFSNAQVQSVDDLIILGFLRDLKFYIEKAPEK